MILQHEVVVKVAEVVAALGWGIADPLPKGIGQEQHLLALAEAEADTFDKGAAQAFVPSGHPAQIALVVASYPRQPFPSIFDE